MRRLLFVANSDAENRYRIRIPLAQLYSGLEQTWEYGIPSYLGHDRHRLIGWATFLGLHLRPRLARLLAVTALPETDEDSKVLARDAKILIARRIEDRLGSGIEQLKRRLGALLSNNHRLADAGCAAYIDDDLAVRVFPKVFDECDKDGLVTLRPLHAVAPGVFEIDGLLLFAHQFLRRSQSRRNSLNEPFLERLAAAAESTHPETRIALDRDMVGLARGFQRMVELEYWWGPKFDDSLRIADGITRHEADDSERSLHGISRSEFWWYTQKDRKTFECEELRDIPSYGISPDEYGCRFVHSLLDTDSETSMHLDGAVRVYSGEHVLKRLEQSIRDAGRAAAYTKLWRIDGSLPVQEWKALITHYFRDNRLVGEYLGGVDEADFRPRVTTRETEIALVDYVPSAINAGDGLQCVAAFQQVGTKSNQGRSVAVFDSMTFGNERFNVVEARVIELVKALRRLEAEIDLPGDAVIVEFDDLVVNLPLILHSGDAASSLAARTEEAIRTLCAAWCRRGLDVVIAWNIGIDYEDRRVVFSYAGHVQDFCRWFDTRPAKYPEALGAVRGWIEECYEALGEVFPDAAGRGDLHEIVRTTGVMQLQRRFLEPAEFELRWNESSKALECLLLVESDGKLRELLDTKSITPAMVHVVRHSTCSRCGGEYRVCNCSTLLDEDVVQNMDGIKLLGCFWTNRRA